jgi:hypothetical protein
VGKKRAALLVLAPPLAMIFVKSFGGAGGNLGKLRLSDTGRSSGKQSTM